MRKILVIISSIIIILILLGIFGWSMLPTWVSHTLSKRTKVSVSIQDIRLAPSSIKVDNIRIGNPPKSVLKQALNIKKFSIDAPFSRFFQERIVINEMGLDDVYIGLEFESQKSSKGNWSEIMANLKESTGKEKESAKQTAKTKRVLIKKLIITDLKIDLAYRTGNKNVRRLRPIDRLELTNISSEGGLPTAQIMDIVISEMLRNIFSKEGLQNMLENILPGNGSGSSAVDTLKGLFSELDQKDDKPFKEKIAQ
jgi:hypothetical protein